MKIMKKLYSGVSSLIFGEIAPISAIVGGVIAQEVIKAVSHKESVELFCLGF